MSKSQPSHKKTNRTLESPALLAAFSATEDLLVDYLQNILGQPIIVSPIAQKLMATGLHRTTLIGTRDMPIYYAITFVKRIPTTRTLIKTMLKHPAMPFGEALTKHKLFGQRADVAISMAFSDTLFDTDNREPHQRETWKRQYIILSPHGETIASVLEIAPPDDYVIQQAALTAKKKQSARRSANRHKHKPRTRKRKVRRA